MNIVPFDSQNNLPAYLTREGGMVDVNNDIVTAAAFPTMSIKGKQFTISRDGVRKVLTKPDDPDEVAQNIGVVILRANMNSKVFYLKKYAEGDSDGARPDCYSYDGVAPSIHSPSPQAKKCALCPQNVWGSRVGDGDRPADGTEKKGKACSDNARLAISAPDAMDPMLLRVPPASLRNLRDAVKVINQRTLPNGQKLQYNAVVMKIGFDREASSPKLVFKPVGLLDDATYASATEVYDTEVVRSIVGVEDLGLEVSEHKERAVDTDELDAAIAAKSATTKAKESRKPAAEPEPDEAPPAKPAKAAKPKPAAEPEPDEAPPAKPAKSGGGSSLLSDLDELLGNKDD